MPYRLVAPPPPARHGGLAARLSERLRHRVGALLGLAVALALVAATAAVFLPRASSGTSATAAAERQVAARATAALRARGIAQPADRADRAALNSTAGASAPAAAKKGTDAAPSSSASAPDPATSSPRLSPAAESVPGGIAWGTCVWQYGGETYSQALARDQRELVPDIIRYFIPGTDGPHWPKTTGSAPLAISFKLLPREVLSGARDAQLAAFFAATPRLTYWTYWHEPESAIKRGTFTALEYREAWSHIAAIARASGKPLRATLVLMGYSTTPESHRTWTDYYAGPDVIDVLAWDDYAWSASDSPATVYASSIQASLQAGKPWAIAETGVSSVQVPDVAERNAMLTAMSRYLADAANPPVFVTYFDCDSDFAPRIVYGWNISHDPAAAAAWRAGQAG